MAEIEVENQSIEFFLSKTKLKGISFLTQILILNTVV